MIETIVRTENLFPQTFADMEERDWGVLFVTPTIPDSHDGNHACVLNHCDDLAAVVDEVVAFYEDQGLPPRVNFMSTNGDSLELRHTLEAADFTLGNEGKKQVYVFHGPSQITPNPSVHVRRLDSVDSAMLAALTSIDDLRTAKTLERRARRVDDWLFVGEIAGQVASVALLERTNGVFRVDDVSTAEGHRRKGCSRAVMHALVTYYQRYLSGPLYLWTVNPIAERIYAEAGFVRIEHSLTNWCAWREGPDTHTEIQRGRPCEHSRN